ncbi:UNVERIFIED_CONTAM: protein FAR-RED IMPAIRED RESPONSE 1 [Sesamum calycinum]|uniref:Protein FAR1-RELATED SEQUENCE n=1 Tax=Sesamum calycinum TaxID=2727403 RepID=A0AAW2M9V7_9LAMI
MGSHFQREQYFLAGLSTYQRSESVNSFFDKYIHKKINLKEFVRQYGAILQNRYEEEDMADFDTLHKQPALRHSMIVLQICGLSSIPSRYILKRWTKDAKSRQAVVDGNERIQTRVQRYNDLCKRAIELGEEECSNNSVGLRCAEEENQLLHVTKANRKKNTNKKRKLQPEPEAVVIEAPDSLQQMENLSSEGITLNGYYGSQQHVHGLLNLMEPPHDAYYVSQQTMQGLGQLNSIASSHDGFYGAQQSMPGLGHLDFRQPAFTYSMGDEHNVRPAQLHGTARHA